MNTYLGFLSFAFSPLHFQASNAAHVRDLSVEWDLRAEGGGCHCKLVKYPSHTSCRKELENILQDPVEKHGMRFFQLATVTIVPSVCRFSKLFL